MTTLLKKHDICIFSCSCHSLDNHIVQCSLSYCLIILFSIFLFLFCHSQSKSIFEVDKSGLRFISLTTDTLVVVILTSTYLKFQIFPKIWTKYWKCSDNNLPPISCLDKFSVIFCVFVDDTDSVFNH